VKVRLPRLTLQERAAVALLDLALRWLARLLSRRTTPVPADLACVSHGIHIPGVDGGCCCGGIARKLRPAHGYLDDEDRFHAVDVARGQRFPAWAVEHAGHRDEHGVFSPVDLSHGRPAWLVVDDGEVQR
jgi:hypothetical protein